MELAIVAAVSVNGVIAKDGEIPWDFYEDVNRFRYFKIGFPVIL